MALKFINPAGVIVYHNTFVAENRTATAGLERALREQPVSRHRHHDGDCIVGRTDGVSTYSYDGFRPNRGAEFQYSWSGPREGMRVDYDRPQNQAPRFKSCRSWRQLLVQRRTESKWTTTSSSEWRPPSPPDSSKPGTPYEAIDLDFRLKAGSKAVDAGTPLPERERRVRGKGPRSRRVRIWAAGTGVWAARRESRAVLPINSNFRRGTASARGSDGPPAPQGSGEVSP